METPAGKTGTNARPKRAAKAAAGREEKPRRKPSTKLTAAQKVERDTKVIALRAKGRTWPSIAQLTGLSSSQCREIHRLYLRDQVAVLGRRMPEDFIIEVLDEFDSINADMGRIRDESTNDQAVVAAARTQVMASKSRVEFLQALGLLPSDLTRIARMTEFRTLVFEIVEVLHEAGMPPGVQERILEIAAGGGRGGALPSAA